MCYSSRALGRCPLNQKLSYAEKAPQTLPTSQQLKETTAHTCRCLIRVSIPMSSALGSLPSAKRSRRDPPDLPFSLFPSTSVFSVLCTVVLLLSQERNPTGVFQRPKCRRFPTPGMRSHPNSISYPGPCFLIGL